MGGDYNCLENYNGKNPKIKRMLEQWEALNYDEKLEFFTELDEWNHHGT